MRLIFYPDAWDDYLEWQTSDRKGLQRLNRLIKETRRTPYEGIGKPEALKGDLEGYWSRRVDGEHRLVYKVEGGALLIGSAAATTEGDTTTTNKPTLAEPREVELVHPSAAQRGTGERVEKIVGEPPTSPRLHGGR